MSYLSGLVSLWLGFSAFGASIFIERAVIKFGDSWKDRQTKRDVRVLNQALKRWQRSKVKLNAIRALSPGFISSPIGHQLHPPLYEPKAMVTNDGDLVPRIRRPPLHYPLNYGNNWSDNSSKITL